jgi:hypothetical protein
MDRSNRVFFEKNTYIHQFCQENFSDDYEIRFCNFGFVVIPKSSLTVYKYYCVRPHMENLRERECDNYNLFRQHDIIVPKYHKDSRISIGQNVFDIAIIENIRKNGPRLDSFREFDIKKLANIVQWIHNIKPSHIHGNIHPSNFYVTENGDLWIFDLITYSIGPIEKDIARIFTHTNYDVDFLRLFLSYYTLHYNLDKIYLIALSELREWLRRGYTQGYEKEISKIIKLIQS